MTHNLTPESVKLDQQAQLIVDMSAVLKQAAKLGLISTMRFIDAAVQEAGFEMEFIERPVIECTRLKS